MTLGSGAVIAERFEVRGVAGRGGMSTVYRALDRLTGTLVALKVTDCAWEGGAERFAREARLLAELRHPAIVRYLAHGATPSGDAYLAMEWLDGEDLSAVLRRRRLEVAEALRLARRVAQALEVAHRRGVVHRDVKPSNVFLPGSRIEEAKILDFGVARPRQALVDLTRTGVALGTPSYMAPEQARGERDVRPAADVYSLGCVLFACLTRRRPFDAKDFAALLAIERAPRPRVAQFRPEISPALDALVLSMMAVEAADRPADGAAVLRALEAIEDPAPAEGDAAVALGEDEQRLHAVILASEAADGSALLARLAGEYGGTLEALGDGRSLIRLSARHAATDLAARAARCALAIRAASPAIGLAIATGRDAAGPEDGGSSSMLARASSVLPESTDAVTIEGRPGAAVAPPSRAIGIDDVTAGLLDAQRFEVTRTGERLVLMPARALGAVGRTLLGKRTTCVARSAELGTLEALVHASIDEGEPKVALVTAPPGLGKSRLRHELVTRLSRSGVGAEVWIGHGDPLGAGAPYRILGGALRGAAGIADGDPGSVQAERLARRLAIDLEGDAELDAVIELVGELVSVPTPREPSVQLRAARQDARLMGDRTRWAALRWLEAACRRAPVLLLLEDLHWGDAASVQLLEAALGELSRSPLCVIALARPELEDLFPRLFAAQGVSHLRLAPLGERACRQLVEQVLGDALAPDAIDAMIRRSEGNPLCLEELIRAAAEGHAGELPETVLAIVQARLEKLEPDARRVLRAASVFGRRFWPGGVCALLDEDPAEVRMWLDLLVASEVIQRQDRSAFAAERELSFRHDLVRDAAYAMLTERDRRTGHRLAAEWLARAGEGEALVLAEHFERGGHRERAAEHYRAAAEKALAGNDFAAAAAGAERAIACDPRSDALGLLRLVQAEALVWQGDFAGAAARGLDAVGALEPGSDGWFAAIGEVATAAGVQGDVERLEALEALVRGHAPATERAVAAVTRLAEQLLITGRVALADDLLALVDRRAASFDAENPGIVARVRSAQALRALFAGDVGTNRDLVREAAARFADAGDLRNECIKRERVGYSTMELGAYADSQVILQGALATAERLGLANVAATARHNLGLALGRLGRFEEASRMERAAVEAFARSGNRRMEGASCEYLALIHLEAGDAAEAEVQARRALALARDPVLLPLNEAESLAILARALIAQGRVDEALGAAEAGLEGLERLGGIDDGEAIIRLAWAEALTAAGRADEAEAAFEAARARLRRRAERIKDPSARRSFLEHVPENARTLRGV